MPLKMAFHVVTHDEAACQWDTPTPVLPGGLRLRVSHLGEGALCGGVGGHEETSAGGPLASRPSSEPPVAPGAGTATAGSGGSDTDDGITLAGDDMETPPLSPTGTVR